MLVKQLLKEFVNENPAPPIPPGHGLLHAPQVDHIIRTDIRIIGHHRTLVLYVYDRKQVAGGNPAPLWTVFQSRESYITLARQDDGSIRWRKSAFERLGEDYYFPEKCAFYSSRDAQRIRDFFRGQDHDGITALVRAQQAILDKRCQERQRRREMRTIGRMRPLRALPRGLKPWLRHEIMPAYFRCRQASARKPVTGVCTSCGKESTLPGASHNGKVACPRCKRELTVKSIGKTGRRFDRKTVQVIEGTGGNEAVIRIVKVYFEYDRDSLMPTERIYENARIFVRADGGKVKVEPYYLSYSRGTPWEYCPIAAFYGHFREPMQMWPFLAAHVEHRKFESLVKTGFFKIKTAYDPRRQKQQQIDCKAICKPERCKMTEWTSLFPLRQIPASHYALPISWAKR